MSIGSAQNMLRKHIEKAYGRIKYGKNRTCFRTVSKILIKLSRFTEQYAPKKDIIYRGVNEKCTIEYTLNLYRVCVVDNG